MSTQTEAPEDRAVFLRACGKRCVLCSRVYAPFPIGAKQELRL